MCMYEKAINDFQPNRQLSLQVTYFTILSYQFLRNRVLLVVKLRPVYLSLNKSSNSRPKHIISQ